MYRKLLSLVALFLILGLAGSASAALLAQYMFENEGGNHFTNTAPGGGVTGTAMGGATIPPIGGTIVSPWGDLLHPRWHEFGYVFGLRGEDEYLKIGNADVGDALVASNKFTIGAWIKSDGSNWGDAGIVTKGYNWRIFITGSTYGKVQVMNTLPTSYLQGTTNINDGLWHHVAGVWDGSYYKLYVDGMLDATSGIATGAISNTASHKFTIGAFESGGSVHRWYDGYIDAVHVFDEAHTIDQIRIWMFEVPEPATIALLGLGGLLLRRRK